MSPGSFLPAAFLALAVSIILGAQRPRIWLCLVMVGTAAILGAGLIVLLGGGDWEWHSEFPVGGEQLHLRLDSLSALFLILLSFVGGSGAAYAREYWSDHNHPASAARGRGWWSGLVFSMGLVLTMSNGLHFLMAWEVFAICGYFLITLDSERPEVRAAGRLYLVASHAGTVCLFAFFAGLAARIGNWDLGPLPGRTDLAPLFWLVLFGFGMKAGFFPLHIWLPSAHANAPSHVSAIMSGVAIKMGLYGIVRFSGWLPLPTSAGWIIIGLGGTSALLGIAFALAQNDLKRLLAYCSVENMGIILIGVGTALLAFAHGDAIWGRVAIAGSLLHVWNHGAFKSLLFFGAGSVLHATGTREMSRLGGLWRTMPWTAGLFALGAIAVSGLPPLNGFISEWLVYLGLLGSIVNKGPSAWAALPAAIVLALSGAIAMATFTKAAATVFLGAPRTQASTKAHECGSWMRGPMLVIATVCIVIGFAPILFWPAMARAIGSWHPTWASSEAPAPLTVLGPMQAGLAILALGAAVWLWHKARANGMRRGLTWDCGFKAPSARMQYTSGSFGGIAAPWFNWVLQPERSVRRPRGYFPAEALRLERVPETVLDRVMVPTSGVIMQISTSVRRLQHGRLQFYIVYVLVGLLGIGALVLFGGVR